MKTIGLLGGMSWHSTALYYRLLNEGIQHRLGGLHSASIIMNSLDFAEIALLQEQQDWKKAGQRLSSASLRLQQAGADFLLIATNTMHICEPAIKQSLHIPVLHIADATADAILQRGFKKAGLLGTAFTMQMDYYKSRLQQKGIQVIIPDDTDCNFINRVIFDELCYGNVRSRSKSEYLNIIQKMARQNIDCVILGCTEITLLVKQNDTTVPLFDTTALHAQAAIEFALGDA
jgi:aspartate racemase